MRLRTTECAADPVQVIDVGRFGRLHTLVVVAEGEYSVNHEYCFFEFKPLPPSLRRLGVSTGSRWARVHCPRLSPGATVQLSTRDLLELTEAPGHLAGCRLELSKAALWIIYDDYCSDELLRIGGSDLMNHLLNWISNCAAECVAFRPCTDSVEFGKLFVLEAHFSMHNRRNERHVYGTCPDQDGISELQRKLETRSAAQPPLYGVRS